MRRLAPCGECALQLFCAHRVGMQDAACAARDFGLRQLWMRREVGIHADVDDAQRAACLRREHIGRCAAAQEVQHHLCCHGPRVGADAVIGQTVIGREQQQARGIKLGLQCFLYLADLGHECLEPPERSLRFGQLVEARKGCTAPRTSRGGRLAHRAAYRSARCHSRPGCA